MGVLGGWLSIMKVLQDEGRLEWAGGVTGRAQTQSRVAAVVREGVAAGLQTQTTRMCKSTQEERRHSRQGTVRCNSCVLPGCKFAAAAATAMPLLCIDASMP